MPRDLSSRKSSIAATGKSSDSLPGAGQKPPPAHASASALPRRGSHKRWLHRSCLLLMLPRAWQETALEKYRHSRVLRGKCRSIRSQTKKNKRTVSYLFRVSIFEKRKTNQFCLWFRRTQCKTYLRFAAKYLLNSQQNFYRGQINFLEMKRKHRLKHCRKKYHFN